LIVLNAFVNIIPVKFHIKYAALEALDSASQAVGSFADPGPDSDLQYRSDQGSHVEENLVAYR